MDNSISRTTTARRRPLPLRRLLLLALLAAPAPSWSQTTALADAPLFSTVNAPGNLSMVLSVEYPTAVSVAHSNRTYSSSNTYLGYFDEAKCYTYAASASDTTASPSTTPGSWFVPATAAASHVCSGQWSGNFLNWASMQTIDTFRWVLTGGYRVIDTSSLTVIEKAWGSGQGGTENFPDSSIPASAIAGATPFGALVAQGATALNMRIAGQGNRMRFYLAAPAVKYNVLYYNCTTFLCPAITPSPSTVTDFSALATDTSPAAGVSANNFGARYTTTVTVPQTGIYSFALSADDGASLYLNGSSTPIATATYSNSIAIGTPNPGGSISLTAGDALSIRADYYQNSGAAALGLFWKLPGSTALTPIGPPGGSLGTAFLDYKGGSIAANTTYDAFMRVKVCDGSGSVGLEANCVAYSAGSKPEGLLQNYSNKLRYSAFGYLNDGSKNRDAGVLRAAQKFIGPQSPVYGSPPATNLAAEWDSVTGVLTADPDCALLRADIATSGQCPTSAARSSGVINYINGFGELLRGGYKQYDPVSELYYAAIRYFKNLGDVPEWSSDLSKLAATDRERLMDGFPVLTNPKDPIIGSCQRNFILGIGDTHTWNDKNVPGNLNTAGEPTPMPDKVLNDIKGKDPLEFSPYSAVDATNQVGKLEFSTTSLATQTPYGGASVEALNSALIAGLAYDAHTTGIREYTNVDGTKSYQTLDTYWLDVQEGGYNPNNQYYLATKYGGFKVPDGFKPYDAGTTTLPSSSWWNGTDYLGGTANKRPNNYYSAGQPDKMQAGLIAAFKDAAAKATASFSTSFSLPVPQVASTGSASYSASYLPANWSGDVTAATLTFDASTGLPVLSAAAWQFGAKLTTQAAGTGWSLGRKIVTWNGTQGVPFRVTGATPALGITSTQLNLLNTSATLGGSGTTALQYLRGDTTNEIPAAGADSTHYYRTRSAGPLGDIVDSKPTVVAAPAFPYGDTSNPGYAKFKTDNASRSSVVYVGSNDGMLHAIDGSLTSSSGGTELFGYVPSVLFAGPNGTPGVDGLASLADPAFAHHYMVDGPLASFDIDFSRTSGSMSTTPDWHTVLIGGLGKGGKGYYAIDVTDPSVFSGVSSSEAAVAGKVLWEFGSNTSLGYTYGKPVVVKVRKYGWVVAVPSGYNNGDGFGHILFLNPKTGALLADGDVKMPSKTLGGLAQLNAYILDPTDGTVDAFYAGDLDGNIWRLDVTQTTSGPFPTPIALATLTSPPSGSTKGTAQPVTTTPFVQIDPETRRRFVLVGTGRLLDSTDISSAQVQTFYAIWDGSNVAFSTAPTSGKGSFPITRSGLLARTGTDTTTATVVNSTITAKSVDLTAVSGWYVDLGSTTDTTTNVTSQSRLVTQMTTSYGTVAFAATVPTGTLCSPGGTSLDYAFAFGTAQSVLLGTTGQLPFLSVADTTTNIGFTSNNGDLALIYGTSNAPAVSKIKVAGIPPTAPQRVNWREVPVAD